MKKAVAPKSKPSQKDNNGYLLFFDLMWRSTNMKRAYLAFLGFLLLTFQAIPALAQTWLDFAHPSNPHLDSPDYPHNPLSIPSLLQGPGDVIKQLPFLVILLEFPDVSHEAIHSFQFWKDLIFGPPPVAVPSLVQFYQEISNGRFQLIPAAAGDRFDGNPDGVIGWVRSSKNLLNPLLSPEQKRAEGIIMADPLFDFSGYDLNGDGLITNDELAILVVFSEPYGCDYHPGHPNRTGCDYFPAGNARITDPVYVSVDSGAKRVFQWVAGIDEVASTNVAAHEFGHTVLGHGDLYGNDCGLKVTNHEGYTCDDTYKDDCEHAACLEGWTNPASAEGYNKSASDTDVSTCGLNDSNDLWFQYTPEQTGPVTISLCNSDFNTTLAVFDSCNGTQLACNDDFDCNGDGILEPQSQVTLAMNAGTTYWIRLAGSNMATGRFVLRLSGSEGRRCQSLPTDPNWFPSPPERFSLMADYPITTVTHPDPWARIHLGFVKPKIITHDGRYSLYDAETTRAFSVQDSQPQAFIIHDPLRQNPLREYFILENRNSSFMPDRGLAIWLINENGEDWPTGLNLRKVVRLLRRGGYWSDEGNALWDGSNPGDGYDFNTYSSPVNSNWTDYSFSFVEVSNISPAGPVMTMDITMPPLFVDRYFGGIERGTQSNPFNTVAEAISAIPEPPRTVRIAGGNYPGSHTISTPCTLKGWKNGNAHLGKSNFD
jgi:M6 family metalloprotease-like protein